MRVLRTHFGGQCFFRRRGKLEQINRKIEKGLKAPFSVCSKTVFTTSYHGLPLRRSFRLRLLKSRQNFRLLS